jgi:ATP-dependent RNA helicase DDX42
MLQGDIGEANADVTQIVKLVPVGGAKWNWLLNNIVQFMTCGSVIIFVTKKVCCKS